MGQIDTTNLMYGKVMPQAVPLEEAVLGALMLDREAFGLVSDLLQPEHFYLASHQHIYAAMVSLSNASSPIDLLTVTEQVKAMGNLDTIGGGYHLVVLTNLVASAANIEAHARIIAQMHIRRRVIESATKTIQEAYQDGCDAFELLDGGMAGLMGIMEPFDTVKSMVTVGQAAQDVLKEIDRAMSGNGDAIPTGYPRLDALSGGFFPGEMTVIAARPGMGKTELAVSCATWAANTGKRAHFVTLEMTAQQLTRRIMSSMSGVSTGEIRRGGLDEVKVRALQEAAQSLASTRLNISAHRSPQSLWQFVRRSCAKKNLDILFVDYAQLMEIEGKGRNSNREQEISTISRTLKRISTEFNIPVVVLAQLSREVEKRPDKLPQLSDLRESGSLEQDPDNVWFLTRMETYGIPVFNQEYDGILAAGCYDTANKMLVYSKKMRSDSQFGLMLDFVNGHIIDNGLVIEAPNYPPPVDFSTARPDIRNDKDTPF